ncbi:MAG: hypothetical protein ABEK16_02625 [Candidatus Nanohalobium sp.]
MGGGTATSASVERIFPPLHTHEREISADRAREILEAEERYEDVERVEEVSGDAGLSVSIQIYENATYEMEVREKLVEGDDFFTKMANYLHARKETFEGDLVSWYSEDSGRGGVN